MINGFLEVTHNGFALLGLAVAFVAIALTHARTCVRLARTSLRGWLQERRSQKSASHWSRPPANAPWPSTPRSLPREQAAVAFG
jgi:hypothetical protein